MSGADLHGARVLVTGASGFLGRHLCRELAAGGARVHGAGLRSSGDGVDAETWHRTDLSEPGAAERLLDAVRPDLVFHLASLVKGARDRALVMPMLEANLIAQVRVLDAAVTRDVRRVVTCGSLEEPAADSAPAFPYAAAKQAAALYGRLYAACYALPVMRARIAMTYGPGPQDEVKLVPYVIRELLAGRSPRLTSGSRAVDWIHVTDVARGMIRLASAEVAPGSAVDIGTGKLTSVREVVRRLFELLDASASPAFATLEDRTAEASWAADVSATTEAIGWSPEIALDAGLRDTIDWFRKN